ncbi:MAG: MATE family efflux transporter, partial [Oscillospiraceae bacterium]
DTMMVGNLGAEAIAAVGLTAQPKFIGLSIFVSLNGAVTAIIARRYGEKDKDDANNVLLNCLFLTLILTLLISGIFIFFGYDIVKIMQGDAATTELAAEYIRILMGGMIFQTITLYINACQRGTGNTKITFRTNLVSNVVNVIFNYLLIEGHFGFPRLEVRGAAIATVIGTVVGCAMAIKSICHPHAFLYLFAGAKRGFSPKTLLSITKMGTSTLAEQLCMRFGFLIFAMTVSSLGTYCFAANQIGMNVCMISFSVGDGLSGASLALVGKSMGEKNVQLAKKYINCCLQIGFITSLISAVIFFTFGRQLFMLFSNDPRVLEYSVFISCILGIVTGFQIPAMVFAGGLRGAGDAAYIAFMALISIAIVRPLFGWFFCYPMGLGLRGAWIGFMCDQLLRFLLNFLRYRQGKWQKLKI